MNEVRYGCDKLTFFRHSAEHNSDQLWWRLFLYATDKEGFSTGKRYFLVLMIYEINHIWAEEMKWKWRNDRRSHFRCFLVWFTDGVGEKERNSTKISQLNLQGLFYLLARRFYTVLDVILFLYLSISAPSHPSWGQFWTF